MSKCDRETFGVQRVKSVFCLLEGSEDSQLGEIQCTMEQVPRPDVTKSCLPKMRELNSSNVTIQFMVVEREERQDSSSKNEESFAGRE
ncbi:hypothetical protein RIR_jg16716.t1 [Rhizophagus irregularis DAOM 181602=DAOM 197198]|nr:hypothetical protein RhiirB3_433032 [Rhizophagus irregularis]GET52404.1 hypothetical protein RIR_jg16716.t1 [Rhizophagus irregularis DAOM 181602=DAOM 197198]